MLERKCDAVGELAIVENRAAAGGAADDRTAGAGRMRIAGGVRLEVAERKGWLAPLVESQVNASIAIGGFEQRFVEGHVPGAIGIGADDQLAIEHAIGRRRLISDA